MANRKKHKGGKGRNTARARPLRAPEQHDEPDLAADIREAVASRSPLDLLVLVSMLLAATDPRQRGPFDRDEDDAPESVSLPDFLAMLIEADEPETSAVLAALGQLVGDELTRSRIRRTLASRTHTLPAWLAELGEARPYRAVATGHVFPDGENVMLGVRLPSGSQLTAVCYVDFNLGTVAKDGFVLDEPLSGVLATMREAMDDDPDVIITDISLAEARARLEQAISLGARTFPPMETDSWPMARPLVEWVLRLLPEGGLGYQYREWSEDELAELAKQFYRSPFGAAAAADDDQRFLLDWLLWYGSAYGPGEPLHWSPTSVEIVLMDALPRKVVAEVSQLSKAPDVLRALIRHSHAERGIRVSLTAETLAAVDHYEPEYQRLIRTPRPQGAHALLAALDEPEPPDILDSLGMLGELDTEPLPGDEPFDWTGIPADIHGTVAEVLGLVDDCCEQLFDAECRCACRRVLARVASRGPAVFRRRGRAETAAAAVCWLVAKANGVLTPYWGGLRASDLMAHFGLSGSPSQRATTMLRAGGFPEQPHGWVVLGSADYLTSARRAEIIPLR